MAAVMTEPSPGTPVAALEVGVSLDDIAVATGWLGDLAEAQDWPADLRFGLELSLEEALTNVISYGFRDHEATPRIRIECWRLPGERVAVRLIDNGVAYDPTSTAEPQVPASIEEARIGGHGVQLMRHFLETLAYARDADENRLTMVAASKT